MSAACIVIGSSVITLYDVTFFFNEKTYLIKNDNILYSRTIEKSYFPPFIT
jgi:hypothetical protein